MVAIIFMFLEWDAETHKLLRYTKTVCLTKKDNKLFYSTFIYDFFRFSLYMLFCMLFVFWAVGRISLFVKCLYELQIMFNDSIIWKRSIFMRSFSGGRYPKTWLI